MSLRELPVVNPTQCTACGDCVAVCPTACLERGPLAPWLARPRACVSCGLCAAICPTQAITLDRRWCG